MWWFHVVYSIIAFVLFLLLSPGMLLTIPPVTAFKVFRTGQTSLWAALVHAVIYVVLLQLVNLGVSAAIAAAHRHPTPATAPATAAQPPAAAVAVVVTKEAATSAAVAKAAETVNPVTPHLAKKPFPCDHNCGKYSDKDCLRCVNCGICRTTKRDKVTGKMTTTKRCLPGDQNGSLFDEECKGANWHYMKTV